MAKQILLFFLLFISVPDGAYACLNGTSTILKDGTILYYDEDQYQVPNGHIYHLDRFPGSIKRLDSLYRATNNPDYLSDKGLLLILQQHYDKAITLYEGLERKHPGRYLTAANLGTAYELAGQNEKALMWIQRAVAIKPASHDSSEWIHVNILKAKLRGDGWITTDSLLGTNFGSGYLPSEKYCYTILPQLYNALFFQLNERISFVKPKDKIVAQLLFDLGNMAYLLNNYEDAAGDYELAAQYGYTESALKFRLQQCRVLLQVSSIDDTQHVEDTQRKEAANPATYIRKRYYLYGGVVLTLLAIALILFFNKRRSS